MLDEAVTPVAASEEAEKALLGALLLNPKAIDLITDHLGSGDFYYPQHTKIYEAILAVAARMAPVDVVTVSDFLQETGDLQYVGGLGYLAEIAATVYTPENGVSYAKLVHKHARRRQLIEVARQAMDEAHNQGVDTERAIDRVESLIVSLRDSVSWDDITGSRSAADVMRSTMESIEARSKNPNDLLGLPTGLIDLDNRISGFEDGMLYIIAGRPSMGKTGLAFKFAEAMSIEHNYPGMIFSLEMPAEQLLMRMNSSLARVPLQHVRHGKVRPDDWPKLRHAAEKVMKSHFQVNDASMQTIASLRSAARRCRAQYGLKYIIVDYIQLLDDEQHSGENKATSIGRITRSLKILAKELHVPVIALSQLNRNLEARPDKRPVLSDLRESGAIEQDADVVIFIYRDVVYNPETPDPAIAELIVAKQRQGPIGTVKCTFLDEFVRFESLARYDNYGGH